MKKRLLMLMLSLVFLLGNVIAQQKIVTGKVTATDGQSLPGVSIRVKGTNLGTSTNLDGFYTIKVNKGQVLVFSFIGSDTQEKAVGDANVINVKLGSSTKSLDEVVVVGYGTQKRANLTGAVSTVNREVLESRPITDVGRALQGTTPGLSITTSSGQIGQNPNIKLRGTVGTLTGTGGAQPLILVDNVEYPNLQLINPDDIESISVLKDAASSSIYGTRGAWGVILITTKSGKKGTPARINYSTNVSFSSPTTTPEIAPAAEGAEMAFGAMRRSNPNQKIFAAVGSYIDELAIVKMREWREKYSNQNLGLDMELGRDFEVRDNHLFFYRPWKVGDMFMKKWTPQQNHTININGGSEKTTYNIGLGLLDQTGVLKQNEDKYKRYNASVGVSTAVTDYFEARGKVLYTNTLLTQPFQYATAVYDPWYYLYRWPENYPYGLYQGKPFRSAITDVQQASMDRTTVNLAKIAVGGTIKPMKDLTIDFDYSFTGINNHYRAAGGYVYGWDFWSSLDKQGNIPYRAYTSPSYDMAQYNSSWSNMNTGKVFATWNKGFKDHSFKIIAGGDLEQYETFFQSSKRNDLIDPNLGEVNLATGDQFANSSRGRWNTAGFFGRLNYAYAGKYLLELNGRYDGSSRLSPGKKWGFFPSMSAGYNLSEEDFMSFAKPVLSSLKFRGSWGSIGNQNTSVGNIYRILSTSNSGWLVNGKQTTTASTPAPISGDLTWETVTTLDFGLDTRFFNGRLGLSADWYQRTTSDMHSPGEILPSSFGAVSPKRNFGALRTTGLEFALDFNHNFSSGLNINLTATLADFTEKITQYKGVKNINSNYEGKRLGDIWGYETDRFFSNDDFEKDAGGNLLVKDGKYVLRSGIPSQEKFEGGTFFFSPGDIKYKDLNGDGIIYRGSNTVEDPGDQRVIGNTTPRYQYGFRLGADWKGIDLNFFLQGVGKRNYWAQGPMFIPGWRPGEAWYKHQLDYWTEDRTAAFYPRLTNIGEASTKNFYPQTKYILNLAYLRLKNLSVGYQIPTNLTRKVKVEKLRAYLSGENLFEWDKLGKLPIDPEVNVTTAGANDPAAFGRVYPYRRSLSFGLQVTL